MLILLSPAKTLDFDSPIPNLPGTTPRFHRLAQMLVDRLKRLEAAELASLMTMSESLGEKTAAQFSAWKKSAQAKGSRPAIYAYQGDVYAGLKAAQLSTRDLEYASQHVRILSGLYGVLKPLDLIQPYRLEMATPFASDLGHDLYAVWRERITDELDGALNKCSQRAIVNLASNEYSKAVDFRRLRAQVINPSFKEQQGDKLRFLSFYGKQARGLMARYLIEERAEDPEVVNRFRAARYRLNRKASRDNSPVFSRTQPKSKTRA